MKEIKDINVSGICFSSFTSKMMKKYNALLGPYEKLDEAKQELQKRIDMLHTPDAAPYINVRKKSFEAARIAHKAAVNTWQKAMFDYMQTASMVFLISDFDIKAALKHWYLYLDGYKLSVDTESLVNNIKEELDEQHFND